MFITPRLEVVIDVASEEASKFKDEYISTEHLFGTPLSATARRPTVARPGRNQRAHPARGGRDPRRQRALIRPRKTKYRTRLERYSRDLTQMARGQTDPVIAATLRSCSDLSTGPADKEQPCVDRRGLCWQDRHRRSDWRRAADDDARSR